MLQRHPKTRNIFSYENLICIKRDTPYFKLENPKIMRESSHRTSIFLLQPLSQNKSCTLWKRENKEKICCHIPQVVPIKLRFLLRSPLDRTKILTIGLQHIVTLFDCWNCQLEVFHYRNQSHTIALF